MTLWNTFKTEKENLAKRKLGSQPRILNLYHGTSYTQPSIIYTSEEGFDMRHSQAGLWGRAVYFAENSIYSNSYRFDAGMTLDGKEMHQMFQARVNVGESIEISADNTLIEPPIKDLAKGIRYDSVKGVTQGYPVYMVYANKKAYPEYLITYTD